MQVKTWDKIIIISLVIISFIPHLIFSIVQTRNYNQTYAVVTVGGQLYKRFPLTGQIDAKEYLVETEYGYNRMRIENEQVAILEADCPDKVCTEQGFIGKPGQSLICLPHKLQVQVEGVQDTQQEDAIDIKAQ